MTLLRRALLPLLWCAAAAWMFWWLRHNPLPDGYQNEYLHVGNAYDLWGALRARDVLQMRWHMYTGYWPWGFYAVPWPILAFTGPDRAALVAANLLHLGVLLAALRALGRALDAPLAPVLALLCPGVFGSLVRYEPNVAAAAWTAAGLACLVYSQGLRKRRMVVGYGLCLGVGLLLDRLTVGFFLVPALLPLLRGLDKKAWKNVALGAGTALLLTAAYYREFFLRHTGELTSQAGQGEIDSAGTVTATGQALYYLLVLPDSQAGPIIGALMLAGLGAALAELARWRPPRPLPGTAALVAAVIPAAIFFTFIAKKQVYYTLPALAPLAVLAARWRRLAWVGVLGGAWWFLALGVGILPGGPPLPEAWVAPRHVLARPPSLQEWPLDEALAAMGPDPGDILIFSEDPTLYEGFVALAAREAWPRQAVRGVTLDPDGTAELLRSVDHLLWVGPPLQAWPAAERIEAELRTDYPHRAEFRGLPQALAGAQGQFAEVGRWPAGDAGVAVFRRVEN